MGSYFGPAVTVNPQDIATSLGQAVPGQQGGQTIVQNGQAGSTTAPNNTTPYASPSSFYNVPLNQMGPYNNYDAWGGMDPNAMVTTGPGKQSPILKGSVMVQAIAQYFQDTGYGKPRGDVTDWVIAQIKKHYTNQGGHLTVLPTIDGGQAGTTPAKKPPAKSPEQQRVDDTRGTNKDQSQIAITGDPGMGRDILHGIGEAAGAVGGWLGLHTPSTISNEKDPHFIPGQGDSVGPKRSPMDSKTQSLFKHLGLDQHTGVDPWVQIAQAMGLPTSETGDPTQAKAGDLAPTLALLDRPHLEAFQEELWNAGFYDARSWTPGVFDLPTKQAVGALVKQTASLNATAGTNGVPKSAKYATTWDVLNAEKNNVAQMGGIDALAAEKAAKKYTAATQAQMDQPALRGFEARLGRAPTAAELAGATSDMDAQQAAKAGAMPDNAFISAGEGGVASVPGVAPASSVAAQYAMRTDPTEYEGHSVANAYGLMVQAMTGGKPVGADANPASPNAAV